MQQHQTAQQQQQSHPPASRIPQYSHPSLHHSRDSLDSNSSTQPPVPAGSPFQQARQTPSKTASSIPEPSSISTNNMSSLSERRLNQRNKDERIRKKIEDDLAKKRGGTGPNKQRGYRGGEGNSGTPSRPGAGSRNSSRKQAAGTVSALRPTPALTVPQHISVADASQLCAAKRTDCVLVVDDEEHLCGIFTAKDLAFRVVGEGLDPRNTPVQQIMTPNPMVTRDTTSATDALQTMVSRGFRHLPVCNEDGDVVGLLDITKVFQESLEKLERAYDSSQKLHAALEGVQSEWGASGSSSGGNNFNTANPLMNYVELLREKMSFPDLGSILDDRTRAITVTANTKVKDAAVLMKKHRTTAVCVTDENGKLSGIFTSKDVVLRVIAAGLNAISTSVVRVMTPHPDTGTPALSIQQALRKMNDGHFLNLPVLEEDGSLAGCVDVLKLTYATLEQISAIGAEQGGEAASGPLWTKFFSSFSGAAADGDTESVVSDSHAPTSSVAPGTPSAMPKHLRHDSAYAGSPSEIHPNDSASAIGMDDDESDVIKPKGKKGGRAAESAVESTANAAIIHDDGTYLFKFLSPSGTTHRFVARYDNYPTIREIIAGKLASDPFFLFQVKSDGSPPPSAGEMDPSDFHINYTDDDGDLVLLHTDGDLADSVRTARKQGRDRVLLLIKGGKGWENAIQATAEQNQAEKKKALKAVQEEDHDDEEIVAEKKKSASRKKTSKVDDELVFGFLQKDMVLPAAIAFLGIAVIGVFAVSRSSHK